jgi:hypothetical protein
MKPIRFRTAAAGPSRNHHDWMAGVAMRRIASRGLTLVELVITITLSE